MDLMTERASGEGRLMTGRAFYGKSPFLFLKSLFWSPLRSPESRVFYFPNTSANLIVQTLLIHKNLQGCMGTEEKSELNSSGTTMFR